MAMLNDFLGITIVQMIIGLFAWLFTGCGVLAAIDGDNRLFNWAKSAPLPLLYEITVLTWPYILWLWWKNRR